MPLLRSAQPQISAVFDAGAMRIDADGVDPDGSGLLCISNAKDKRLLRS
jgi:hypothetical protein